MPPFFDAKSRAIFKFEGIFGILAAMFVRGAPRISASSCGKARETATQTKIGPKKNKVFRQGFFFSVLKTKTEYKYLQTLEMCTLKVSKNILIRVAKSIWRVDFGVTHKKRHESSGGCN